MIDENELEKMWRQAVMTQLTVLALHLPEGAAENNESLSQDTPCPRQDSNQSSPAKYKSHNRYQPSMQRRS
jgi:hypothetical protein